RVAAEKRRVMEFVEDGRLVKADLLAKQVTLKTQDAEERTEAGPAEPLREELMDFARCIKTRMAPRVSPLEARRALELALGISATIRSAF
ncbi:MAG: hypothetical protein M0Z75_17890, partial [Nitrospiraceae bacterium]|nr:hypothetical protein [Nitrospiraceae bacterium]